MLLHLLNTVLLWTLLRRCAIPGAWLAAAVFAVHPLHVESVASVIARKDLLSGACYLGAFLTWLRFSEKPRPGLYVGTLALYAAGILSKSIAVTLPVALLLWRYWYEGRIARGDYLRLIPFFLVGAAMVWFDYARSAESLSVAITYSVAERITIAAHALWFYLGKLLWPAGLMVIYPHWDPSLAREWIYVAGAACLVATLWLGRAKLGRGPLCGALFFGLTLSPVLGLIQFSYMDFSFVADRYQYLAGIGVIALVTGGAVQLASGVSRHWRAALRPVAGGVLALLSVLTWKQATVYKDQLTLFTHVVSYNPEARGAQFNLSLALKGAGRADEALAAARLSAQQFPEHADSHVEVGSALLARNEYQEAEAHLRRAIELDAGNLVGVQNLAEVLRATGECEEAIRLYGRVAESDPNRAHMAHAGIAYCQFDLGQYEAMADSVLRASQRYPELAASQPRLLFLAGWAMRASGQPEQAREWLYGLTGRASAEDFVWLGDRYRLRSQYQQSLEPYRMALDVETDQVQALAGLGESLLRLNRHQDALASLRRAIAVEPAADPALNYLAAQAAAASAKPEEAESLYLAALGADPDYESAMDALARMYFGSGRYEESVRMFGRLVDLNPESPHALVNLGSALYMRGRYEDAIGSFDQALALDPSLESARSNREAVRRKLAASGGQAR